MADDVFFGNKTYLHKIGKIGSFEKNGKFVEITFLSLSPDYYFKDSIGEIIA